MTANTRQPAPSGLDAQGFVLVLFRHKWKILLLTLVGLVGAAAVYALLPPVYESSSKLLVRYVLERSAIDSVDSKDGTSGNRNNDGIINSEVEILTSWDLAAEVAESVGIERLATKSSGTSIKAEAARAITLGLTVTPLKGSNVITVSYRHRDPELASLVLTELVTRYFTKHLEVHRSVGASQFMMQQTDQVRGRLRQTEEELKQFKSKAGILSLPESSTALGVQLGRSQEELLAAEAERAEQLARVRELEKWLSGGSGAPANPANNDAEKKKTPDTANDSSRGDLSVPPSSADVQKYQALTRWIERERQAEHELLSKYTPQNMLVKQAQQQIEALDRQRRDMESRIPSLAAASPAKTEAAKNSQIDLVAERARLAAVEAKTETLRAQVRAAQDRVKQFSEIGTQISELERRKEVEETNYKYFESSREKARIDEALKESDPSKIPNINVVQKASPPAKVVDKLRKIVMGIAAGGLALGIAIAMLFDLVIDKTVKSSNELETRLRMPVMRSIPYLSGNGNSHPKLQNGASRKGGGSGKQIEAKNSPSRFSRLLRPFCNEIRDRIILHFEVNRLKHKPKLIAVTGCADGSGISSIASGLAASLSEAGDEKILLVDMNMERAEASPFFEGNPACSLSEAIEPGKDIVSAADNLYLATAAPGSTAPVYLGPKKFYEMLPRIKASDFDYIIFDMPPLSKSSATIAVAGFMDKVLLVVEAEKDNRDVVKRAYADLLAAKADVSAVVNKTRSYAPQWLGLNT